MLFDIGVQKFNIFLDFTGQVLLLLKFVLLAIYDLVEGECLGLEPLNITLQLGYAVVVA